MLAVTLRAGELVEDVSVAPPSVTVTPVVVTTSPPEAMVAPVASWMFSATTAPVPSTVNWSMLPPV